MSATELGELEALLERVLPDPRAFAERVFEQMVDRLTAQVPNGSPTVVEGYDAAAHQALIDRNMILAAAVGACDCWGYDPTCAVCGGEGSAGWTQPDAELFIEFVEPAARRMADESAGPSQSTTRSKEVSEHDQHLDR
jgi:hypothetical protein